MKKRVKPAASTWTIRESKPLQQVQGGRDRQLEPAKLEFPNITI